MNNCELGLGVPTQLKINQTLPLWTFGGGAQHRRLAPTRFFFREWPSVEVVIIENDRSSRLGNQPSCEILNSASKFFYALIMVAV